MTAELRHRLRSDLADVAVEHDVPGVSVAVLADGETIEVARGVENTRILVDVTAETLFQIQSTTKICTATLVMQLLDDGRLWLTREPRHESVSMARAAGVRAQTTRQTIRPTGRDTLAVLDEDGRVSSTIGFLDPGADGRSRHLADGRTAPRTDAPSRVR